jgi:uncharacterized repeat protein (TIGR03803 family)
VLYLFQSGADGVQPEDSLVFDSAGNLYGTTVGGGTGRYGTVFKLTPSSGGVWTESSLYSFTGSTDGGTPYASLVFDAAGNLYGTASSGGALNNGVVFELTPTQGTWTEKILYDFAGGTDGSSPESPLIFDSAGKLYGTTRNGGTSGCGAVFELQPNGNSIWSESLLYSFASTGADGCNPKSGLTFDGAGNLYGTTFFGALGCGMVFQLAPASGGQWIEKILYNFASGYYVGNPYGGLIFQGGSLFGTSGYGGPSHLGNVFKLSQSARGSWAESTIYWFPEGDGTAPQAGLVADSTGNFYGTTAMGGRYQQGAVFKLSPSSDGEWTESLIYSLKGAPDGASPYGGLTFDNAGNLYGTTSGGGTGSLALGTVFELTPSTSGEWTETVLYSFTGGADGQYPFVGVVLSHGSLLGTTSGGGNSSGCYPANGCGVVFELTPSSGGKWTESIIHTFAGARDGANPGYGLLSPDISGNLYGSTIYTGCDACLDVFPTVFELSPNGTGGWTFNTVYAFTDFELPVGGFVFDSLGNMYGTTNAGAYRAFPTGSVFVLTHSGGTWSKATLHGFSLGSDGGYPFGGVTFDAAGNLYGTTSEGGNNATCVIVGLGCGVVYKLSPGSGHSWNFRVLHSFNGSPSDGADPHAGVTIDSAGNVYGTTWIGGADGLGGDGTVFEVTP